MTIQRNIYLDSSSFRETILAILENETIKYSDHAISRMIERQISQKDIRDLLASDYDFLGTQSENGMVYMCRPAANDLLPHVVFGVDNYKEANLNFINVVTVYHDTKVLDALDGDDNLAMQLERTYALSHKREGGIKEQRLVLNSEQKNQLFLLIHNEIYMPNVEEYGLGMIKDITTTKEYIDWTLQSNEGAKTYRIEGRTYENMLGRIRYSEFKKKSDVNEVVPLEGLPLIDNTLRKDLVNIEVYDVWANNENIKEITASRKYGKIVMLTIEANVFVEQSILKYEGQLDANYDYLDSPIVTFMMYDEATVYTIRRERQQISYAIRGKSHELLKAGIDNYEEKYGTKLRVPRMLDSALCKKMEAYVKGQLNVLSVIGYSTNMKEALCIVILKNHNVKHILMPHTSYHAWLNELGIEINEEVAEEVKEEPKKKRGRPKKVVD